MILIGVIAGPHEPSVDCVQRVLEPIVKELLLFFTGVMLPIGLEGINRLVKCQLLLTSMDNPASRLWLGLASKKTRRFFCSKCKENLENLHLFNLGEPRTRAEVIDSADAWKKAKTQAARDDCVSSSGARCDIF